MTSRYARRRSNPFSSQFHSCPDRLGRSPSPSSWLVSFVASRTATLQRRLHSKIYLSGTSVLARAPTCHDPTNFSNKASRNNGLGGCTQNFGKKSERRRDEKHCRSLPLSLFLVLFSFLFFFRRLHSSCRACDADKPACTCSSLTAG